MKTKLDQEIWYIGRFGSGRFLEKMKVGYIGKEHIICYEQLELENVSPIPVADYGISWFHTKKEALEWLRSHNYETNDNLTVDMRCYVFMKKEGK